MKIRTDPTQPSQAAEDYLRRYRRRGRATRVRVRASDVGRVPDHAQRSKPNHAARTARLPFVSLGAPGRPVQKPCPSTPAMTAAWRVAVYHNQNGAAQLTRRQARRANHKIARMEADR